MTPDLNQTVREIAIEHPATVRVFESLGSIIAVAVNEL